MKDLSNTQFFHVETGPQIKAKDILEIVYGALKEKGYNPVNQIVGYITVSYTHLYRSGNSIWNRNARDDTALHSSAEETCDKGDKNS